MSEDQISSVNAELLEALKRNRAALDLIDPMRPLQYATTMDLMRRDMSAAITRAEGLLGEGGKGSRSLPCGEVSADALAAGLEAALPADGGTISSGSPGPLYSAGFYAGYKHARDIAFGVALAREAHAPPTETGVGS